MHVQVVSRSLSSDFISYFKGSKDTEECSIKSLDRVATWVLRCCSHFVSSDEGTYLVDGVGFKIPSLITEAATWEPIMNNEIFPECLCDGLSFLVLCLYRHSEFSKVVGNDQYIPDVTVVRLERQIIHTY